MDNSDSRDREIAELKARLDQIAATPSPPPPPTAKPRKQIGCLGMMGMGVAGIFVLAVIGASGGHTPATTPLRSDPDEDARGQAAAIAKMVVPRSMKDPSSAQFGRVWGVGKDIACGYVNGKNSFGALTGQQRFIFYVGSVFFEAGTDGFARRWNTTCVYRLTTVPPTGAMTLHWGDRPSPSLKLFANPAEGLAVYVPRIAGAAVLAGVAAREADLRFDHSRLYAADYFFDGEPARDAIKSALNKQYGRPLDADNDAESYAWRWPARGVSMAMTYNDDTKRTSVQVERGK